MAKTNDIKENFSALLRDSLRAYYGRVPSAAVVARDFNLRAYETTPISQESARRWLRGVSIPEDERLRVLVNWLNLDFNAALRPQPNNRFAAYQPYSGRSREATTQAPGSYAEFPQQMKSTNETTSVPMHANGFAHEEDELIRLIMQLDELQRHALLDLIKIGFVPRPAI